MLLGRVRTELHEHFKVIDVDGIALEQEWEAVLEPLVIVGTGELDTRLAATWPAYDAALKAANVPHEGYIYPGAVHGFNCDATPERYNKAAADLAWQRTIGWFNKYAQVGA